MATKSWTTTNLTRGVVLSEVTLAGGDSSNNLDIANYPDKTIHVFGGTFGTSTVSVKGFNNASGTAQPLHRTDDSVQTFSGVGAEVMAHILENPAYIQASASAGTGTGLVVSIVSSTPRG